MAIWKNRGSALAMVAALSYGALVQAASPGGGTGRIDHPSSKPSQRAEQRVNASLTVVRQLQADPQMKELLHKSKGLFVVPTYGRAAFGIGANGGAGVLVLHRSDGTWSGPAFYNLGGLTLGLQAGAEGGAIALILINDRAVSEFMKKHNFTLSADTGLTVVNWSKLANATAGTGDVVAWSSTKGLFGDAIAIGLHDIRFNQGVTNAYYKRTLWPQDIAEGNVSNPQAQSLQQALSQATNVAK